MTMKAAKSASLKAMQAWVRKTADTELKLIYRMVRVLRRKRGMSVEELSARSGVTEYLIRRIESGTMPRVTLHKLCRLAFVLVGSITEFMKIVWRGYERLPALYPRE
jgi:transcriptional regulator with XRE-family HTH domain